MEGLMMVFLKPGAAGSVWMPAVEGGHVTTLRVRLQNRTRSLREQCAKQEQEDGANTGQRVMFNPNRLRMKGNRHPVHTPESEGMFHDMSEMKRLPRGRDLAESGDFGGKYIRRERSSPGHGGFLQSLTPDHQCC
jgi:hypothetical protein